MQAESLDSIQNTKMSTYMGVEISGFDSTSASSDDREKIAEQVYKNKLVVLKNQTIDCPAFINLADSLGETVPYLQSNYHHPEHPEIFVSSNVKLNDKSIGVPRTGGYWHSDTAFLEQPVPLTLLYPQVIPVESARTTLFIDLAKAYDELPEERKIQLASINLMHSGRWKYKVRSEDAGYDISEILAMIDHVQPPVSHPAVIDHPVTGVKSIFATRGFTVGVEDKNLDESKELLDWLFDYIEQDQFVSTFQWEIGDLIIWDNRFLAHKSGRRELTTDAGSPSLDEEDTMVFRISVNDRLPLSL